MLIFLFPPVNLIRILDHRVDGFPFSCLKDAIETTVTPGMTGYLSDLLNL
jgi:hypothetical protein